MTRLHPDDATPNFRLKQRRKGPVSQEESIVLALGMLEFLAQDGERLDQLLAITGLDQQNLRENVAEPGFLAGILDYLLSNEPLLLEWARYAGLAPEAAVEARRHFPGGY